MTTTLKQWTWTSLALASLWVLLANVVMAAEWTRVAYDDAGVANKEPHLVNGSDWRFANPGVADEAARTAAFGEQVEFGYGGLNPRAAYKVKLRFFSDGPREERVAANGRELLKSVTLEAGKVVEQEVVVPQAAYAAGKLTLAIEKINGPNAVVSEVEVFSTDPAPLGALPSSEAVLPRLSPRPVSVTGVAATSLNLEGTWRFHPDAPAEFAVAAKEPSGGWADIRVPGEWVMQGFKVEAENAAGYRRTFLAPKDWKGKRVKLRCDGVYSEATVWINGKEAGQHLGGFTPFELDVTDLVKPGEENVIALAVTSGSLADRLASGSRYASHPLGGIPRKVTLFVLPETNLAGLHVATTFDKQFHDARLDVEMEVANEGAAESAPQQAVLTLADPDGKAVSLSPDRVAIPSLKRGAIAKVPITIPVASPLKWDNEHPNLYRLSVRLESGGKELETVMQRIGFRQVEVRGTRMFVNNVPVKLHGVCRHEVHPLTGRSLTDEQWRKDAEIFRAGNCNFIRTSHYPPAEEFVEACDELGLFVELEAPLCWVNRPARATAIFQHLLQVNLETVQAYFNHPSVIIHSLANESNWNEFFARVHAAVREADPTRPATFHDQCWGKQNNFGSTEMPIAVMHYPGLGGPAHAAQESRPVQFGEYCHLNSYNRRELVTDPGLRDLWGQGLELMWEKMRDSQGCLGGSIWAAIDDTFFLPSGETVGYGTWGPIDGWRRPKPEFWHMKKAYSPLRLRATCVPAPAAGQLLSLEVENRHDFTNLSELRFQWKLGDQSGSAKLSAPPGGKGILLIPLAGNNLDGKLLEVRAIGARGFEEDSWQIAIGTDPRVAPPVPAAKAGSVELAENGGTIAIRGAAFRATVDAKTGMLSALGENGKPSLVFGPELLLLPLNADQCGGTQMSGKEKDIALFSDCCQDWTATSVKAKKTSTGVEVQAEGAYAEAKGSYVLRFGTDGLVTVDYAFTVSAKGRCDPRQIGIVFTLPAGCQTLSWRRKAFWSSYPEDHIGRAQGTTTAFAKDVPLCGLAGPRVLPWWSWSRDGNKYGSNDFRSTKMNIFEASLRSANGNGIRVLSNGSQHVRSWVDGDRVHLLVADYTNDGAAPFFNEHTVPRRPLHAEDEVKGTVRLEIQ